MADTPASDGWDEWSKPSGPDGTSIVIRRFNRAGPPKGLVPNSPISDGGAEAPFLESPDGVEKMDRHASFEDHKVSMENFPASGEVFAFSPHGVVR